ncbi:helix-turn-helix transcriptional regulator [Telluribacter humicola]|uniref:helix-turn-helix transcriptional regulator n=1 Tax=Telluribacter humicola TaxID=1720261 RepID=UPI001A969E0E|nr:LuxR family transcriptional regulator [Telluribacter humicola]
MYQLYYYLCWPRDSNRKYYLILLALLITKNLAMGLFPDPQYEHIPIVMQYGFTYAAGFIMASYFPFYFYKSYNLTGLRFHAVYGVFLFLYLPFILTFIFEYALIGNIDNAIAHGLVVPAIYSLVLASAMWKSIQKAFQKEIEMRQYWEIILLYCSVVPFIAIAFFPDISQATEAIITNSGFTILTVLFIRRSILQSRQDRARLLELLQADTMGTQILGIGYEDHQEMVLETNMNLYQLSEREKEVVRLVRVGKPYKIVGSELAVKERTIKKHIEKIFEKVEVTNKAELLHKIMQEQPPAS